MDLRTQREKEYVARNRELVRLRRKNYYETNKDMLSKRNKLYSEKSRYKRLIYAKEYRESNKEKVKLAKQKCWYAKHEHYIGKAKEWRTNNLDRSNEILKISAHRRRANIKGNGGSFTVDEWIALKIRYYNQCLCCGGTDLELEVDHVVPLTKQGTSNIDNIQPLCRSCNASKSNKIIDYRIQYDMVRDWT